jgi:hypothetical protein
MKAIWLAKALNSVINRNLKREPDFVIGGVQRPYMLRWFIIARNRFFNIYHHLIKRSDDDRALHDHPWWSLSLVLDGGMLEILPGGVSRQLKQGDIVLRRASSAHRLEIRDGYFCKTLFITGPRIREWGFHCPQGWKHWKDFVSKGDSGSVGPGCNDE